MRLINLFVTVAGSMYTAIMGISENMAGVVAGAVLIAVAFLWEYFDGKEGGKND